MSDEKLSGGGTRELVHKIGCARTIPGAVLVTQYLRDHFPAIGEGLIRYHFTEPTDRNGWWLADILVTTHGEYDQGQLGRMVEVCRAFSAGRGEIW